MDRSLPLFKRTENIPDTILNVWKKADEAINPQARLYKIYKLTTDEQQQLAQAIAGLPKTWQQAMQQKFSRFFFIDQLLGGGITDWIIDVQNKRAYTMILNPALFKTSAKEWLEKRENASFKDGSFRLTVEGLEGISALQYILWHEAAHLIDFETLQTPINDPLLREYFGFNKSTTAFTKDAWKAGRKKAPQPLPGFDFPARKNINPYHMNIHRDQMDNLALKQSFADWAQTPFVTIYASSSWAEDFADFAAFTLATRKTGTSPRWLLKQGKNTVSEFVPLKHPINRLRFIQTTE